MHWHTIKYLKDKPLGVEKSFGNDLLAWDSNRGPFIYDTNPRRDIYISQVRVQLQTTDANQICCACLSENKPHTNVTAACVFALGDHHGYYKVHKCKLSQS